MYSKTGKALLHCLFFFPTVKDEELTALLFKFFISFPNFIFFLKMKENRKNFLKRNAQAGACCCISGTKYLFLVSIISFYSFIMCPFFCEESSCDFSTHFWKEILKMKNLVQVFPETKLISRLLFLRWKLEKSH